MTTTVRFTFILLCLCIALSSASTVAADEILDLRYENEVMESELALTQKAQVYLILNLKEKKIFIKTRGANLRELPIDEVKGWDLPTSAKPHPLLKKSSLFKPRREEINPKEKEKAATGKFQIDALELEDMPSRFNLILDDGLVITVRPKPVGVLSQIESTGYALVWHLSRPLLTVWESLGNKHYSSLYLSMYEKDAQALYWSFYEGSKCIIYNP